MLQTVDVGKRSLAAYRGVAPDTILDDLTRLAEIFRGARVVHINATPYGGGVSELLRSVVPLMNDLGILTDWKILSGDDPFFQVTKKIHNGMQGAPEELTTKSRETYLANAEKNARLFEERYDFIFIHDPQPAGLLSFRGKGDARWIWRCHIDTSHPNRAIWDFLKGFLADYDAAIFTMREFIPPDFPIRPVAIIPPAIDPLSPKNMDLPARQARQILAWIGVELDRPLMTQVSRFDPWKDPLGVIAAYRLVREEVPNLQLALVGSMALDDTEGWEIYRQITTESRNDPLIHVFTNLTGVGNIEVNAFQRLSDVIVQKSIREGFGLVVSEAMWKGTPVVAGRAGGIPLQMADGAGGLLVEGVEACAEATLQLLKDSGRAGDLARLGRERVKEYFLTPRLLLNHLSLLLDLSKGRTQPRGAALQQDPVCGMAVEQPASEVATARGRYVFCSEECRRRSQTDPAHYLGQAA
ncbi:MAG: glycosyltransferase [Candidatus Manganitrophaceae bacterium]|nr:MAG: glycosyltransferase [Candidatus Manganitrophaceae bacterium]